MNLQIPMEKKSYVSLVTNSYYVDKTLLIKELLDDKGVKVTTFLRPRRFGKTLNLDMLKVFFEKTSIDTSKYFKDKLIWKAGEQYRRKQGKHPVISLSFKNINGPTLEDSLDSLKKIIKKEFVRHLPVVKNSPLRQEMKEEHLKFSKGEFTLASLKRSLYFLTYILKEINKEKVVLLIDEYDAPIRYGYLHNYGERIANIINDVITPALKTNESNLFLWVLCGISNIFNKTLFNGLNNTNIDSVLEDKYSPYFGFTENEVKEMISYYGFQEKLSEIKKWYGGYKFGILVECTVIFGNFSSPLS